MYLTPEYASLDTGFLAQVQNSVGKKKFDKDTISMLMRVKLRIECEMRLVFQHL